MYSWLVLMALLAVTCFVLAYRGAGRRYWVATTLLMAAALYLQYYGLYLLAATVIVGSAVAVRRRRGRSCGRRGLRRSVRRPLRPLGAQSYTSSATRALRGLPTPPCSTFSGIRSTPWPRPPGPPSSSPWSSPCFPISAGSRQTPWVRARHARPEPGRLRSGLVHRRDAGDPGDRLVGGPSGQLLGAPYSVSLWSRRWSPWPAGWPGPGRGSWSPD